MLLIKYTNKIKNFHLFKRTEATTASPPPSIISATSRTLYNETHYNAAHYDPYDIYEDELVYRDDGKSFEIKLNKY